MILQSDLVETGRDRIVAPLTLKAAMPPLAGRLIPVVRVEGDAYVVLVPSLTAVPSADLCRTVANLGDVRDRIIAALNYLFLGL